MTERTTSSLSFSRRSVLAAGGVAGLAAVGGAAYTLGRPGGKLVDGQSRARAIPSDPVLPQKVDVVVIGGGNIGTATALTLAERGVSVALFEKGVVAGEASGRSFGLVENLGIDPSKMELMGRSKELWTGMNARTGNETGYARNGLMCLARNEEERAGLEMWLSMCRGLPGVDARFVDRGQVDGIVPGLSVPHVGGLYEPGDGQAEPQLTAPAMALGARAHGAKIIQNCAVRGIERAGGKITGVVTEKGRVACQAVVLAGGSWSPLFLRSLGVELPQFEAGTSSVSVALPTMPKTPGVVGSFGWRPMWNGRVSLGDHHVPSPITPQTIRYLPRLLPLAKDALAETYPVLSLTTFWEQLRTPNHWPMDRPSPFEKHRIAVSDLSPELLKKTFREAKEAYAGFAMAKPMEYWGGFMSTTLDNTPVIDRVAAVPGLYVGSGFNFGLAMAPATGEALADLVMHNKPKISLEAYRLNRFFDGTKLTFKS